MRTTGRKIYLLWTSSCNKDRLVRKQIAKYSICFTTILTKHKKVRMTPRAPQGKKQALQQAPRTRSSCSRVSFGMTRVGMDIENGRKIVCRRHRIFPWNSLVTTFSQ
ncbi:unnamed protein product [Amoebophrya sp. A120]|nr:unnamed protein product [Amoebophrya sp. A120]|eukprot:GSA120T00008139001.1